MILRKAVLLVVAVVLAAVPSAAHAQASVYGEFSTSDFKGAVQTNYLFGGTTGLLIDGPRLFHKVLVQANLQGRFLTKNGESFQSGAGGARFIAPFQGEGFRPYAEFLVGFGRFQNGGANNPAGSSVPPNSTDSLIEVNVGATHHLKGRFDVVLDYSYAQFGANAGQYRPKTYNAGIIFHLSKADSDDSDN